MSPLLTILISISVILLFSPAFAFVSVSSILESSLKNCLLNILQLNIYYKPTALTFKSNEAVTVRSEDFFQKMTDFLVQYKVPRLVIDNINHVKKLQDIDKQNVLCFIYFNDCEELSKLNVKSIHMNIKYILILDYFDNNNCHSILKDVGQIVGHYDVLFITKDSIVKRFKIITFLPEIDPNTCVLHAHLEPTIIDIRNNNVIKYENLFPSKKPKKFHKCPLKVGMAINKPFFYLKEFTENDTVLTFMNIIEDKYMPSGCDAEIIQIIADYLDASLELYNLGTRTTQNYLTFVEPILNGTLDACAGGMFRVYGDIIEYSGIYARQAIIWIYSVSRLSKTWQHLFSKLGLLYIFFLLYLYYCFVYYVVGLFDNSKVDLKTTFLYSWGCLFGSATLSEPKTIKEKILNTFYLVMCIYFVAYVSIQLYSYFTIEKPPIIYKTNEDIMNSGRKAFVFKPGIEFISDEKFQSFMKKADNCKSRTDCLEKILKIDGLTISIDKDFIELQANTAVNDEAKVLRATENIVIIYHEILINKNSFAVKHIQNAMERLMEAGLLEKFYVEAVGQYLYDKSKIATEKVMSNSYSCQMGCSIDLKQVAGAFYVWLIGCAISTISFILEIMMRKEHINGH